MHRAPHAHDALAHLLHFHNSRPPLPAVRPPAARPAPRRAARRGARHARRTDGTSPTPCTDGGGGGARRLRATGRVCGRVGTRRACCGCAGRRAVCAGRCAAWGAGEGGRAGSCAGAGYGGLRAEAGRRGAGVSAAHERDACALHVHPKRLSNPHGQSHKAWNRVTRGLRSPAHAMREVLGVLESWCAEPHVLASGSVRRCREEPDHRPVRGAGIDTRPHRGQPRAGPCAPRPVPPTLEGPFTGDIAAVQGLQARQRAYEVREITEGCERVPAQREGRHRAKAGHRRG